MDNKGWAILTAATGGAIWYVNKVSTPRPLTQDEYEALRPAPFSTEGDDRLTPDDLYDYSVTGAIGLSVEPEAPQPAGSPTGQPLTPRQTNTPDNQENPENPVTRTTYPGIWTFDVYLRPGEKPNRPEPLTLGPESGWNSPRNPAGTNDKHNVPREPRKHGDAKMRLGTLNIKNYPDMPRNKVAADARRMGQLCSIWGGQEIQPGEDTPVVMNALGSRWGVVFANRANPIFYRTDMWEAFDQFDIHIDRHDIHLTPKQNSAASVAFRSKLRDNLEPFAVANTHLIVGAYTRKASLKLRRARRPIWQREFGLYGRAIDYQLNKGRSVFYLGDFNHPTCPVPVRNGRWITPPGAPDRIGFVRSPGGVIIGGYLGPRNGESHKMNSDHNAKVINVRLKS